MKLILKKKKKKKKKTNIDDQWSVGIQVETGLQLFHTIDNTSITSQQRQQITKRKSPPPKKKNK